MGRPPNGPQPIAANVGQNVRTLREWRGWTLDNLERHTMHAGYRINRACLHEIEQGRRPNGSPRTVTVDQLAVLARVFGVNPVELMRPGYQPRVKATRSASASRPQTGPEAGPDGA